MSETTDKFISELLESRMWESAGIKASAKENTKIVAESTQVEQEDMNEEEEVEVHMCPLCESHLESPLVKENVELFVEALFSDDEDLIAEDVEDDDDIEDSDETDSEDE